MVKRYFPIPGVPGAGYRVTKNALILKVGFFMYRLGVKELALLALLRMVAGTEEIAVRDPLMIAQVENMYEYRERVRRLHKKGLIELTRHQDGAYMRLTKLGWLLINTIAPNYYDVDLEALRKQQLAQEKIQSVKEVKVG